MYQKHVIYPVAAESDYDPDMGPASGGAAASMAQGTSPRKRVVIVGGGFGGLAVAMALRHARAWVMLIDRSNHHLFQPLLYQVRLPF